MYIRNTLRIRPNTELVFIRPENPLHCLGLFLLHKSVELEGTGIKWERVKMFYDAGMKRGKFEEPEAEGPKAKKLKVEHTRTEDTEPEGTKDEDHKTE